MTDKARTDLAVETWNALLGAAWPIFTDIGERTVQAGTTSAQISLLNVLYDAPEVMAPLSDSELRTLIELLSRLGPPIAGVPEGLASRVRVRAGNAPRGSKPRRKDGPG